MTLALQADVLGEGPALLLVHGLFGDRANLRQLALSLKQDYQCILVDVRNHGRSPRSDEMTYPAMAQDMLTMMSEMGHDQFQVLGHSMGGKIAMQMALLAPERIQTLMVADIAPVVYPPHHSRILDGLLATEQSSPASRAQADQVLQAYVNEAGVRSFLLKSLYKAENSYSFRFNVPVIQARERDIADWPDTDSIYTGPVLFLKGGSSDYILADHQKAVQSQFPGARLKVIAKAGHWLHSESPALFNRLVSQFLAEQKAN